MKINFDFGFPENKYNLLELRKKANSIISSRYDENDRIDDAYIAEFNGQPVLFVKVNFGNVGEGIIEEKLVL